MRLLIQRVKQASVVIDKTVKSEIKNGMLILIGIEDSDKQEDIDWLTHKVVNLRIFDDENGVMNNSIIDSGGDILVVSQFTLYASVKKGNRPSYIRSSKSDIATPLYEKFCETLRTLLKKEIFTGEFGANMQVSLINDGPVTIWIDSKNKE